MNERRMSMTLDIGADISKVKIAAQELQNLFKNTSLDPFKTKNLQSMFNGLNDALADLEKRSGKALSSLGEGRGVDASKKRVLSYIQNIAQEFQELEGLGDTQLSKKIKGLSDSLEQSSKAFDRYEASMKSTKDQAKDLGKQLETLQDIQKKQERLAEIEKDLPNKRRQATRTSNEFEVVAKNLSIAQGNKTRTENRYKKYIEENSIQLTQKGTPKVLANQKDGITQEQIDKANQLYEAYDKAAKAYAELNKDAQNKQDKKDTAAKELTDLENEQKTLKTSLEGVNDTLEETKNKVNQTQEAIKSFNQEGRDTASFEELKKTLKELFGDEIVKDIDNTKEGIQTLKDRIENISTDRVKELRKLFPELFNSIKGLGDSAQTMGKKVDEGLSQFSRANEASQEISHLASRLKYFFSLAGGFQLMRRAIRSAVDTTKELDAVMTQTAVVSDYSVGDMWKTLPQYSKYAKDLGAQIKDVYSAQTLYVQQGLNMNDAMDLGIETLKMARVAGIDAAEATNSMTAALRGFNMELNETSAVRINDVYSKLAQNTASDVQEISTAMSKVAALANSANMSFENTSAFLATIIESTREGAETAGTALKTVIARFTEVKKLYSEGELIGTDEEGQEVDVNKISAALRTAGINMNDFFTGAKGLDEIFMELGSKWDSLTTVQQRYIATMAAGSRQQSRFLALMQNYSRTVELTQMAYNSAGSGQEQFEKTLDSLEAKLNKLKAAWDTFTMGIANSDFIKGVIDAGTKILELINNIIDKISGGSGAIKSVLSLGTAFGIFKAGGSIFKGILGNVGTIMGVNAGKQAATNFMSTFIAQIKSAEMGNKLTTAGSFLGGKISSIFTTKVFSSINLDKLSAGLKSFSPEAFNSLNISDLEVALGKYGASSQAASVAINNLKTQWIAAGQSGENFDKVLNDQNVSVSTLKTSLSTLSIGFMMVGGALLLLTNRLESTGKISNQFAKFLKGLGISLIAFGAVLKTTQMAVKAFAISVKTEIMSIPVVGWIIAIIAAVIALGAAIADIAWETSAEKAERLKKESEDLKNKLDDLKNNYSELQNKLEELSKQQSTFDNLIEGTEEYNSAVQELNQSILELIRIYPDLADVVEYVNGKFVLNDTAYKEYLENKKENEKKANALTEASTLATAKAEKKSYGFGKILGSVFWNNTVLGKPLKLQDSKISDRLKWEPGTGEFLSTASGPLFVAFRDLFGGEENYKIQSKIKNRHFDEIDYLAEAIANGELYLSNEDKKEAKETNNIQITTLLEKYLRDNNISGEVSDYNKYIDDFASVLLIYQDELIELGKNNKKIKDSENYLKNSALLTGYDETKVSKSKYSNDFYKIASVLYNTISPTTEELTAKKLQEGYTKADARKIFDIDNLSDEAYNEWIKSIVISEKTFEQIDSYYTTFLNQLNDNQKDQFLRVTKSGLQGLTIKELDNIEETLSNIFEPFNLSQEQYLKILGIDNLEEATVDIKKDMYSGIDKLFKDNVGKEYINKFNQDFTAEEITLLSNQLGEIITRNGNVDSFIDIINTEILGKIKDPNKLRDALDIIAKTDFSNVSSIQSLQDSFAELGITINNDVINSLSDFARATKVLSTKTLEERVKELESAKNAANKILDGEKTISLEEYQSLSTVIGTENMKDFVSIGTDEYVYIGDQQLAVLNNIYSVLNGQVLNDINKAANLILQGQGISNQLKESNIIFGQNENGENITLEKFFNSLYTTETENLKEEDLNSAAEAVGIAFEENLTNEAKAEILKNYFEPYKNLEQNQELYSGLTYWLQAALGQASGQEIINSNVSEEQKEKILKGKAINADVEYDVKATQKELWTDEQEAEKYGKILRANAFDAQQMSARMDKLTETYKNNAEALKSTNKEDYKYQKALRDTTKAIQEAFGNNKIDEKFVQEHIDLFEDYANGVKDSEKKIRQALLDEGLIDATPQQLDSIKEAINELNGANFSIDGTANFDDAFTKLAALYNSAEEAAQAIESLGYTVTWEETGKETLIDGVVYPEYRAVVKDNAGSAVNRNSGGGGGGGGGKKEFKNDFDKYYNMVEDINELERLRNLLETDYQQLLKSEAISGKAIYDNLKKQIQLLKERRDITADLAEKRKGQIFETMDDNQYSSVRKYAWWNDTDQTIEIDWDAINKVKDSEQGDLIKEYVSKLEGFQSQYDEQIEALEDIETTLQEIQERGQEEYTSLEDRTRDALIKQIQDKIDELTAVDEAINDTNQKLMDSIQRELEKQRQERENAKTEEELADKEQRLAYLQQDSSGANALEIVKLQEELADARESYTDSLIDQKITELQEQNDEAAQQRQEQIDLMQQSLDWQEKSGAFWEQVYEYIQAGTDEVGTLVHGSELENLLKAGEAWDSLSEEGQMKWLEELENQVAQAIGYLSLSRQLEEIGTKEGTKITFTDAEGNTHTGAVDKNGNVVVKNADGSTTTWKDVYQSYDGTYHTLETSGEAKAAPKPATNSGKPSNGSSSNGSTTPGSSPTNYSATMSYESVTKTATSNISQEDANNKAMKAAIESYIPIISALSREYTEKFQSYLSAVADLYNKIQDLQKQGREDTPLFYNKVNQYNELSKELEKYQNLKDNAASKLRKAKADLNKYKTGGLADYTGPAWLDGTPSKPELVLNARDTENFIQLKDHLAALRQAGTLNAGGDNYYDIDVHVDSLGSDYDVDMAIDRIKTRLYQDGAYRNVNTLNRLR